MHPKHWFRACALLTLLLGSLTGQDRHKADWRVVFIGEESTTGPALSKRARAFTTFLEARFTEVRTRTHRSFDEADRRWCDVVVLDWHQDPERKGRPTSPLGRRGGWNRPAVLIGSAGLNTAMAWNVFGGSG